MSWSKTPGESFKEKRIEKHYSQAEIEKNAGVAENTISKLENNKSNMTLDLYERLAHYLGCDAKIELIDRGADSFYQKNIILLQDPETEKTISLKIKKIDIVDSNEVPKFDLSLGTANGIPIIFSIIDNIIKTQTAIQLIKNLLEYKAFEKLIASYGKAIKIEFYKSKNDYYSAINDVLDAVCDLRIKETYYDEHLHFPNGFSVVPLFRGAFRTNNIIYLKLTDDSPKEFFANSLRKALSQEEKELCDMRAHAINYPNGLPFVCGISDKPCTYIEDEPIRLYSDYSVINAWDEKTAKEKYLDLIRDDCIYYFFEEEFIKNLVSLIEYGEIKDIVDKEFTDCKAFYEFLKKIDTEHEAIFNKYLKKTKEERYYSYTDDVHEKISADLTELITKTYTKEELVELMGLENFKKFFDICYYDYVYAVLDEESKKLIKPRKSS